MIFLSLLFKIGELISKRSTHRPKSFETPHLQVSWLGNSKKHYLKNENLEEDPIFNTYDKAFLSQYKIPEKITYRGNPKKWVKKETLENLLENLLEEIQEKKKKHFKKRKKNKDSEFTNFKILRSSNFNRKRQCGCLIVQFKNYPFVAKLFKENPESFVHPYSKGLVPMLFFNMGGGTNRHLLGFTRIKNLEEIKEKIAKSDKWTDSITSPRKWFWTPKDSGPIEIIGKNIEGKKEIKTVIPGTYFIIADAIELEGKSFSIFNKEQRETCMALCNFLDVSIDPHIDNFILEKGTNKIAMIDTEHFPTLIGFKEKQQFSGYFSWISQLAVKFINDMFFRPKNYRRNPKKRT